MASLIEHGKWPPADTRGPGRGAREGQRASLGFEMRRDGHLGSSDWELGSGRRVPACGHVASCFVSSALGAWGSHALVGLVGWGVTNDNDIAGHAGLLGRPQDRTMYSMPCVAACPLR